MSTNKKEQEKEAAEAAELAQDQEGEDARVEAAENPPEEEWYGYEPGDGDDDVEDESVRPAKKSPRTMSDPFEGYDPDKWRGKSLVGDPRFHLPPWIVKGVLRRRTLLFTP